MGSHINLMYYFSIGIFQERYNNSFYIYVTYPINSFNADIRGFGSIPVLIEPKRHLTVAEKLHRPQ